MKLLSLLPLIAAEWDVWQEYEFCDYEQNVLVSEEFSSDPSYNKATCTQFCKKTVQQNNKNYYFGDVLCCDYEEWADGTFDCYLYEGGKTQLQDINSMEEHYFASFIFYFGD